MNVSGVFDLSQLRYAEGQAAWWRLHTGGRTRGQDRWSPIHVAHGVGRGPVLYVGAGAHGDEITGIEAARRLALRIDPRELRGTLVVAPVQNAAAYDGFSHASPSDSGDLIASYPGRASGSYTERLAAALFEIITRCDAVIDLHTAAKWGDQYPSCYVFGEPGDVGRAAEMARCFGFGAIVRVPVATTGEHFEPSYRPALYPLLTLRGIPSVLVEAGEGGKLVEAQVELIGGGLINVMRHLKMLDGEVEVYQPRLVTHVIHTVRSPVAGLLHMQVHPGDLLHAGETVAHVIRLPDEKVAVESPIGGVALRVTTRGLAEAGERLVVVGVPLA